MKTKLFYGICKTSIDYIVILLLLLFISCFDYTFYVKPIPKKSSTKFCMLLNVFNVFRKSKKNRKSFWCFTLNAFSRQSSVFFATFFLMKLRKQNKNTVLDVQWLRWLNRSMNIWLKHGIVYKHTADVILMKIKKKKCNCPDDWYGKFFLFLFIVWTNQAEWCIARNNRRQKYH